MNKIILFSSAASLFAATGVQAADLPIVEPVDYVRVCDAFGAGFHYIPGTETCLKFSGRVRAEIGIGDDGEDDDETDTSFLNSEFELVINASSMTEIGLVVGQFSISGENEGDVEIEDAWITIGENILVGRETSRYDFGGGYGIYDGLYVDEGINQFTFIMPFGNGLSMTLGLEDGRDRRANIAQYNGDSSAINWISSFSTAGGSVNLTGSALTGAYVGQDATYAGMEIPEVVASARISQGWGSAQISGALHQIRSISTFDATAPYTTVTFTAAALDVLDEDYGWAVQAGVELNVGSMTKVKVVGAYADGAMHYIGGEDYYDAVVDITTGDITDTLSGWYVLAGLSHDLSSALNVAVTGAYHDFDDQAELWQVSANIEYEVVENLTVSLAGQYTDTEVEQNTMLGTDASDTDSWEAKLRIQRDF